MLKPLMDGGTWSVGSYIDQYRLKGGLKTCKFSSHQIWNKLSYLLSTFGMRCITDVHRRIWEFYKITGQLWSLNVKEGILSKNNLLKVQAEQLDDLLESHFPTSNDQKIGRFDQLMHVIVTGDAKKSNRDTSPCPLPGKSWPKRNSSNPVQRITSHQN